MTDPLDAHRSTLRTLDSAYKKAKKIVESDDYKFKSALLIDLIEQFKPGDSGDKAVFLIGQMSRITGELRGPLVVIQQYEGIKKTIEEVADRRLKDKKEAEEEQ